MLELEKDFETAETVGASGTFQIKSAIFDGVDITNKLDCGKHYFSNDEVLKDLELDADTCVEE